MTKNITTNDLRFAEYIAEIGKDEQNIVHCWFSIAHDCMALGLTPTAYARLAYTEDGGYLESTIRQTVGMVVRAIEIGYVPAEILSLGHLRVTMAQYSKAPRKGGKQVDYVARVVKDVQGASQDEIKAAIKALRDLLK